MPMATLRFLCETDPAAARQTARQLVEMNRERRKLSEEAVSRARQDWLAQDQKQAAIVIFLENLAPGLAGIVAGHLAEEFHRPVFVFARGRGQPGTGRPRNFADYPWAAAARSAGDFNLVEAMQAWDPKWIVKSGGRPGAAAVQVPEKYLPEVTGEIRRQTETYFRDKPDAGQVAIDCGIPLSIAARVYEETKGLKPWGPDFDLPVYATRNATVLASPRKPRGNNFSVLSLGADGTKMEAIIRSEDMAGKIREGQTVNIAYHILPHVWYNGPLQLDIQDARVLP